MKRNFESMPVAIFEKRSRKELSVIDNEPGNGQLISVSIFN